MDSAEGGASAECLLCEGAGLDGWTGFFFPHQENRILDSGIRRKPFKTKDKKIFLDTATDSVYNRFADQKRQHFGAPNADQTTRKESIECHTFTAH